MTEKLAYWVYTSAEESELGRDYGVKHASSIYHDRRKLEKHYTNLLDSFELYPSLRASITKELESGGLLVLPDDEGYIAGFVFPGTERFNTSAVIVHIPERIARSASVYSVMLGIWRSNDIPAIAEKDSNSRPDFLSYKEIKPGRSKLSREYDTWPDKSHGWIMRDDDISILERKNAAPEPHGKGWAKYLIAALLVVSVLGCLSAMPLPSFMKHLKPKLDEPRTAAPEPDKYAMQAEEIYNALANDEYFTNFIYGLDGYDFEALRVWQGKKIIPFPRDGDTGFIDPEEFIARFRNILNPRELKIGIDGRQFQTKFTASEGFTIRKELEGLIREVSSLTLSPGNLTRYDIQNVLTQHLKTNTGNTYGNARLFFRTNRPSVYVAAEISLDPHKVNEYRRFAAINTNMIDEGKLIDIESKIRYDENINFPSDSKLTFTIDNGGLNNGYDLEACLRAFIEQFTRP